MAATDCSLGSWQSCYLCQELDWSIRDPCHGENCAKQIPQALHGDIMAQPTLPWLKGSFGRVRPAPAARPGLRLPEAAEVIFFEGPQLVSPNGLWPVNYGNLKMIVPSIFF